MPCAQRPRPNEIPIHSRDGVHADLFRAGFLTLSMQRAAAEVLEIHLLDHAQRASIALGLALRQQAQMGDFCSGEQRC